MVYSYKKKKGGGRGEINLGLKRINTSNAIIHIQRKAVSIASHEQRTRRFQRIHREIE